MKVLFHLSLKHCLHAEGRRNVMEDCSGLNYVHVWIKIIRKLEQRRRRRRVWRVSPRTTPGKKCFHILSAKSAIVQYVNGSRNLLRLNMQWQRSVPNGNTKNQPSCFLSSDCAEFGHFTLLFSGGRQINEQRGFITHVHSYCSSY